MNSSLVAEEKTLCYVKLTVKGKMINYWSTTNTVRTMHLQLTDMTKRDHFIDTGVIAPTFTLHKLITAKLVSSWFGEAL